MDSDEEDFVFVGTPIEREEELYSRKKKALAESSGHLRTLVPWKQEVRDEEGRRRFHGAFTGGYSAGYYNTVGSKEGWTPQSFTSSRKNRAEIKQQNISSFLDDDEKAEMEGKNLGTSSQFDTFGFTAAEHARKQAEKEQSQRPAIIPGPVPDELVTPASDSIGVKLLLKMGWRHGRSIKDARSNSQYDARREARKALLALSSNDTIVHEGSKLVEPQVDDLNEQSGVVQASRSTPAFVLQQKQDMHGLGYDPYKEAPEFRDKKKAGLAMSRDVGKRKHSSIRDEIFSSRSGRVAPGFGIGALEELDAEDEDVYGSGYNYEETYVQEVEEPPKSAVDNKWQLMVKEPDGFPRFSPATKSDHNLERFNPPEIPKDFVPHHKFPVPLLPKNRITEPPPMEVPSPEDNNLKVMIEGVASLVARCGKLFEDLSREKNQSNPLFSFLSGGLGSEYYARKLWEEQQKRCGQAKLLPDEKPSYDKQKLSADSRGRILGERPLERSLKEANASVSPVNNVQIQTQLSDNFTAPELSKELLEIVKPFKHDPAKQERFEQFIKDKYQGGLRSTYSSGANDMSEAARAHERLDFEAAAEAIEKSKRADKNNLSTQQLMELTMNAGLQFTSGGVEGKASEAEESTRKMYPRREEFTWRPAPLLCKRFDIVDPYMGKPPPAPRSKSKLDALFFSSGTTQNSKVQEEVNPTTFLDLPHFNAQEMITSEARNTENEVAVEVANVERPVDLYKAIFSDDDEEEEVPSLSSQAEDPQRKIQAASATFSRLIAGDFLESLGKELGMQVPQDTNLAPNKIKLSSSDSRVDTPLIPGDTNSTLTENKLHSVSVNESNRYEILQSQAPKAFLPNEDGISPRSKTTADNVGREREDGVKPDKMTMVDRKSRDSSGHHDYENKSSSSSEEDDERSRKRYKRQTNERFDTESDDSSGDYRDNRHSSGSRSWKKRYTRDKSHHKRKHSSSSSSHKGSHKRSREDYPGSHRSQRSREKDHSERKREKHKRRER